ncbi:MAG: LOG family protein [Synechococcales bacterium]|nr:LOG family protein [Synechococcales bacterium]
MYRTLNNSLPNNFAANPPVCRTNDEVTFTAIQDSILQLWDVVNHLTSIQPPKRSRYCVTIFGSARLQASDRLYEEVRQLASELTHLGCDIITGGGPGLMQAANEGSVSADPQNQTQSIGIRVNLDFEQHTNPYVEQVYNHRTFFSRLHHFILMSDAFVVVPGGIGTTLEALMVWQLLQVGHLADTPLIFVGDMWQTLHQWAKQSMTEGEYTLANPKDMTLPHCVDRIEEAIALIQHHHQHWQQRPCPLV